MNERISSMKLGTAFVVIAFGVVLLLVGVLFQDRMGELLTFYTEGQTRRQAEALAGQAAEKLGTELENLSYIASKIEANPGETRRLMPMLLDESGVQQGLLTIDGHAMYGNSLSLRTYDGIQTSFRGKSAVTFVQGQGILFTCPVFHGKNIKYVLYRLYPPESIAKRFSISCYDDIGKVFVATRGEEIVIPSAQSAQEDIIFLQSEEMKSFYQSMHREMEVSVAAARTFRTERGNLLLFEAEVPGTDYLIVGFVPKSKVSEGIENITFLVVWVFGLLMLLVIFGAVYLLKIRVQIHESEELKMAKAEAEKASRAKSDFLANMSHEIRTPINAVLGMNEMILRESGEKNILFYAENVRAAGNMLLDLVNDILDFSKIEAGKVEIIPVKYDLSVILNDLVNMVQIRARSKGLYFSLDFDRDTPRMLYGDEVRIKQVITNILTNAVKYTEKGGVTLSVGFDRIEDAPEEVLLHIVVADTGIGIKKQDLSKLFLEFERIEEKRNRHVEGTGLGMAITRNLLEKMGSTLKVDSVYGAGSTFSFTLRQKVIRWEALGGYEEVRQAHLSAHKGHKENFIAPDGRILVMDDNAMNLMVFENLLKQTQVGIETARDGDEGLLLTRKKKYDIIFIDHMMPGKDGIETMHELRRDEKNPNIRTTVVCLTANAISGAREQYLSEGFDDYLSKPVDPGALTEMLMKYLPKKKIQKIQPAQKDEAAPVPAQPSGPLDSLKSIAWLDTAIGIRNNGSAELYLSILKAFCKSVEGKSQELEGFYAEENLKDYTIRVHALKSTARLIGAMDLGEKAEKLEQAGKNGNLEYIREHHGSLLEEYRGCGDTLSTLFAKDSETGEEKPEADGERLRKAYEELRSAADEMDCDRLEAVFAGMKKYRIPKAEEDLWKQLKHASDQYEYDMILTLLEKQ